LSWVVRVFVLGELAVETGERVLDRIGSYRARSLLGWLAVHPGLHPRARVAAVFWPDVLDTSARSSLRTTIATLRRELGQPAAGLVTATRDRLGIEPGPEVWIDLHAFEQLVTRVDLEKAAILCRGDVLEDLDDDWVNEVRERHSLQLLRVLGQLAEEAEVSGDFDVALQRTREQVTLDPLSEEVQRELVRRLAATGDRPAALAAYQSYCERLRRELGIAPSSAARELAESVRSGGVPQRPAADRASVAPTEREAAEPSTVATGPITQSPAVRYAKNGSVHLAFQSFGEGGRDFVLVPGLVSNLEFPWEHPPYRRFMNRLAAFARVTVYDKRGMGLSDPLDVAAGFDQHLDDLAAVIDAAQATRPVLMGWSDGAAVAALFAAHHPGEVESLVLYGAFPKLLESPDYPEGGMREQFEDILEGVDQAWGEGVSLSFLASEKLEDEDFCRWWGRYERASASPGLVLSALRLDSELDIREVLPAIHVPTLLIHRTEDPVMSVQSARFMAERIPDACLVELPGTLHWPWLGDTDAVIEEIEEFLTGKRQPVEHDRALATVLFTDVVGSAEMAAELGDRRWRALLEDHNAATRRELEAHRGNLIRNTGDGVLATFDRPAAAIRCAECLRESLSHQGIQIRAGLHTGEIELIGQDVGGMAVRIAARVSALAGAKQTLATRTVKDLVVGAGIEFEEAGAMQLEGVPGDWELFAIKG
jgi:pimeloyl-ACP methyl ester carboxylesterase/DNA-binding SARP family transcriptional activator